MTAGSSPDIGKNDLKGFVIPIIQPPVVEIDTEATAAYIRLRNTKVVATKPYGSEKGLVIWILMRIRTSSALRLSGNRSSAFANSSNRFRETSDAVLNQTRYVAADLQPA